MHVSVEHEGEALAPRGRYRFAMSDDRGIEPAGSADEASSQPGWYADPFGRHELRYHNGQNWTEHVSDGGTQATDAPVHHPPPPSQPSAPPPPSNVSELVSAVVAEEDVLASVQGTASWEGGGHLLNEPILVVSQKAQVFEANQEYAIHGQSGALIGYVRQVGQSQAKQALRMFTSFDQYMTHHLEVLDAGHNVVLRVTRPAKLRKSKVIVQDAQQQEIGQIMQKNVIGKIRFELVAGGQVCGSINAENWRAWNFRVDDDTGTEVARITKTWEGLAKDLFTTADNYVVHIHRPVEDPLRSLLVASAVSVDIALKQDDRGLI
jgi:hypothetical protein